MESELPTVDLNKTFAQRFFAPLGIVLVTVTAAGIGWLVVGGLDRGQRALFVTGPAYALWRMMIGITVAVAVAGTVFIMPVLRELRARYPSASLSALTALYLIAIAGTAAVPRLFWGRIEPSTVRIGIALVLVAVAMWPAVAVIWVVRARVRFLAQQPVDSLVATTAYRIEEIRSLRAALITALTILAMVVSISVLNTGQLRNARIAAGTAADIPPTYALLYGAVLAGLLAVLFVPVHLSWQAAGTRILDASYPIVRTDAAGDPRLPDDEWRAGRDRLTELMGLANTATAQFRAAFTTLAPFLTGLLAYFLK
ncbi:hypothetical protein ACQP0C_01825 [Nocardia sp. CA-129566]|uniref:hypothetical protein n=1 Tax=Nocardia sp. CA-129566 TaxID=3239976 RepID=UPI003D98D458